MKSVKIKTLEIVNFKGVENLKVSFESITDIFGANAAGKTTIFDAFTWLLFGKDSRDRKDFEIKNTKNLELNRQDHEVTGILLIDNEETVIKRVYREKWVKQKGALEAVYTGNETLFYWNDLPLKQSEFQQRINLLLDEKIFKMITNPLAFSSLKWQDRRSILIDIAGDVSYDEIITSNPQYKEVLTKSSKYANLEEYKKAIAASIKKSKDDLKAIPTRIDEVLKGKPEELDFAKLKEELSEKESELSNIENQIQDANKAFDAELQKINEKRFKINTLKSEVETIKSGLKREAENSTKKDTSVLDNMLSELSSKKQSLVTYGSALSRLENDKKNLDSELSNIEKSIVEKRNSWISENEKTISFDTNAFCCPTCKRDFEASDIETKKSELTENFNKTKVAELYKIEVEAKLLQSKKEGVYSEIENLKGRITTGIETVDNLQKEISLLELNIESEKSNSEVLETISPESVYESLVNDNNEIKEKLAEISTIESEIKEVPKVDNNALIEQKNTLKSEVDNLKIQLTKESQIMQVENRVAELKDEEKRLAQAIADVEKEIYQADELSKLRIDQLESKINSKFKFVRFKMFDVQINGGEVETCEALIDSVPFDNANTAGRINAGIDIINTLCQYYQVNAPIFIDNSESVHTLIDTESQLVRLVVSEQHKQIEVSSRELVA